MCSWYNRKSDLLNHDCASEKRCGGTICYMLRREVKLELCHVDNLVLFSRRGGSRKAICVLFNTVYSSRKT